MRVMAAVLVLLLLAGCVAPVVLEVDAVEAVTAGNSSYCPRQDREIVEELVTALAAARPRGRAASGPATARVQITLVGGELYTLLRINADLVEVGIRGPGNYRRKVFLLSPELARLVLELSGQANGDAR